MNAEAVFQDLGVNAITGTHLFDLLGLSMDDMHAPQRFFKLQAIIKYLGQFPEDTQRLIINKSVRGKTVDKLDHVFEYTLLLKEKSVQEKELEGIDKELSALGITEDHFRISELQNRQREIKSRLNFIQEEKDIYEK